MLRWRPPICGRQRTDMPQRNNLRASDADREHVAERLRQAAAEGRLLAEELEQRLGTALKARTYGELDGVVADLPATRVGHQGSRSAVPFGRPVLAATIAIAAVAVIAAAVLVVTGVLAAWGLWMLVAWWAFGGRYGHRRSRAGSYQRRHQMHGHAVGRPPEPRAWL
jgi:uncharacterized membrane protein YdbT with pleckstrin-like domain